jgi:DNA-binding CsgD family transcriptional regulator
VSGGEEDDELPRVSRFRFGKREYAVLSVPHAGPRPEALTPVERNVVASILEGKSNREIARARGTSERTVANQVASVFGKLRVGSRAELVALLAPDQ